MIRSAFSNRPGYPGRLRTSASDHRHRGAKAALQLAGEGMGAGHGQIAELLDRLTAAADGLGDALMAIGLDAIRIDVHDQAADFAAGSFADRHGGRGVGRQLVARPHGGCKDCVAPRGAPTGHAARPDPCSRWGWGMVRWSPRRSRGDRAVICQPLPRPGELAGFWSLPVSCTPKAEAYLERLALAGYSLEVVSRTDGLSCLELGLLACVSF